MDTDPNVPANPVVSEDPQTQVQPPVVTEDTTPAAAVPAPAQGIPYDQYHKVLREKKALEDELALRSSAPPVPTGDEPFSDEGKLIVEKYVTPLQQTVVSLQDELALKDVQAQFPMLKELSGEFDEFRKDYPRHKLANVAKLFLSEKGLIDTPRQGLEKPTGGDRTPPSTGMTSEEIKTLRTTNWPKYQDMLRKGLIKVE